MLKTCSIKVSTAPEVWFDRTWTNFVIFFTIPAIGLKRAWSKFLPSLSYILIVLDQVWFFWQVSRHFWNKRDQSFDRAWGIFRSYLTKTCYFFDHPRDLFITCFIKVPTELEEHFNRSWLKFVNTTFQDSQQSLNIITSISQAHSIDTFYYHFRRHYIHPPQEKLWIKKLPKPADGRNKFETSIRVFLWFFSL